LLVVKKIGIEPSPRRELHMQKSNFNRNREFFCFFSRGICRPSGGSDRFSRSLPSHVLRGRAVWHALTFLRSALCGRPAGSSYLPTGSWPNGSDALAPLNHLSACLRPSPSQAGILYQPCVSLGCGKMVSDTPPFHRPASAHRAVLPLVIQPRTSIGDAWHRYSVPACPAPLRRGLGALRYAHLVLPGLRKGNTIVGFRCSALANARRARQPKRLRSTGFHGSPASFYAI